MIYMIVCDWAVNMIRIQIIVFCEGRKTLPCLLWVVIFENGESFTITGRWFHIALLWRHNEHNGVSNHQPHHCLLDRLFRRRPKKTYVKLFVFTYHRHQMGWTPNVAGRANGLPQLQSTSTVYWCIASKLKASRNFYWMSNMFCGWKYFFFLCAIM